MPEIGDLIGGRYRIVKQLGQGGMGVVYEAEDVTLERRVALKCVPAVHGDLDQAARFRREARAAAGVSHPNVCHVYEVGGEGLDTFIAMELLQGEVLADRLARGPLETAEALQQIRGVLTGLAALHQRGLVHRDLKPSNILLTMHGVKLVDFGLAREINRGSEHTAVVTTPGAIVGSPAYMAPEQALGRVVDERADLFSVGVVLFEMLTGRSPFLRATPIETLHAVIYEHPPALGGSAGVAALDRVIRKALEKKPDDRHASAANFITALDTAERSMMTDATPRQMQAIAVTRLVVMPFRLLRPDADIDFLPFGLADAIATSLSGLSSLVVRSTMSVMAAANAPTVDLRALAREVDVDVVLTGTLMRAGERLRLSAQLVSANDGSIVWSQTLQVPLGDVFQLQDDLCQRIVESLALPLSARDQRQLHHDVPSSARAYELFLRANNGFYHAHEWAVARELYKECVASDPNYAPAWARLGRCFRLTAKFEAATESAVSDAIAQAKQAFQRAFEINADLPAAHHLYTPLECDLGGARSALIRLLSQATRRSSDPELFAGLVHACRYAGLLDASVAAHERARQLDARVPTSVAPTYALLGQFDNALEHAESGTNWYFRGHILATMGRQDDALKVLRAGDQALGHQANRAYWRPLLALLEQRAADSIAAIEAVLPLNSDPESRCFIARSYAPLGYPQRALDELRRSLEMGYCVAPALETDPWLESVRSLGDYPAVLQRALAVQTANRDAFVAAGGERVLGMTLRG